MLAQDIGAAAHGAAGIGCGIASSMAAGVAWWIWLCVVGKSPIGDGVRGISGPAAAGLGAYLAIGAAFGADPAYAAAAASGVAVFWQAATDPWRRRRITGSVEDWGRAWAPYGMAPIAAGALLSHWSAFAGGCAMAPGIVECLREALARAPSKHRRIAAAAILEELSSDAGETRIEIEGPSSAIGCDDPDNPGRFDWTLPWDGAPLPWRATAGRAMEILASEAGAKPWGRIESEGWGVVLSIEGAQSAHDRMRRRSACGEAIARMARHARKAER